MNVAGPDLEADSGQFESVLSRELVPMLYDHPPSSTGHAPSLISVQAGSLGVFHQSAGCEQTVRRVRQQIADDRADYYLIAAPIVGARFSIQQNGVKTEFDAGHFGVVSTSAPFEARTCPQYSNKGAGLYVRIPGPQLRSATPAIGQLCGQAYATRPGRRRMMLALLEMTFRDGQFLSQAERDRLGHTLFDAICAVAGETVETASLPAMRLSSLQQTVQVAKAFITARLGDSSLSPQQVARHCGVSARYLHAAFSAYSKESVAQWIREMRLQGCKKALSDPLLADRRIIEIAGEWGFDNASHFGHLYRSRFGHSPRSARPQPRLSSDR